MQNEDDLVKGLQERSGLSESQIRENLRQSKLHKEEQAKDGRNLESIARCDVELLKKAAAAYFAAGLPDDRNRVVKRILEIVPNDPEALYQNLNYVYARLSGSLKDSLETLIAEYSKLYEFPEYASYADESIEHMLYECGEYERAIPYQKKLGATVEGQYANKLAHSLYECGRYQEALELFRSGSYLNFSLENRERYAHVLEIFGKKRKARRMRFHIDEMQILLEMTEKEPPKPDVINKQLLFSGHERSVLSTLFHPGLKKESYENAQKRLNTCAKTFTIDEIKTIEQSALEFLGVTSAEYHRIVTDDYYLIRVPHKKEIDRRRRQLMEEKYPDLLEHDESDEEEEDFVLVLKI